MVRIWCGLVSMTRPCAWQHYPAAARYGASGEAPPSPLKRIHYSQPFYTMQNSAGHSPVVRERAKAAGLLGKEWKNTHYISITPFTSRPTCSMGKGILCIKPSSVKSSLPSIMSHSLYGHLALKSTFSTKPSFNYLFWHSSSSCVFRST